MMRFKPLFSRKDDIDEIDRDTGQMIFCEDSGDLLFDTPTNDRVPVGLGWGGTTRTFGILLRVEDWQYNGVDYVQLPDYSPEIFKGVMYDEEINIIVTLDQSNTEALDITARPDSTNTRLEFVSDILPVTNIVMKVVALYGYRTPNILSVLLKKEDWEYDGVDYVQSPDYNTNIFKGTLYDESVNVIVVQAPDNPEKYNVIARPDYSNTRLEFVSDILPNVDIVMKVVPV